MEIEGIYVALSERAVEVNIEIMRAFVKLRRILVKHQELKLQLENLENKYDLQFKAVFDAIRELMQDTDPPAKRQIGFGPRDET